MKRLFIAVPLVLLCLQAHAAGRLATVTIIDRATGDALPTHYYRGEYWVAGTPGARYSIAISNHTGERLLAVTAVDGVNVVSGDTASWGQTGYVYAPAQGYEITGWRKNDDEVAAFEFTAAPNSYAARTGRAANIGVIGVALFRERRPRIMPVREPWEAPLADRLAAAGAPSPARPVSEASSASEALSDSQDSLRSHSSSLVRGVAPEVKLGTGHGQREGSHVENVGFERQQDTPNEVVRIRYDSTANLIAMGVIRRPTRPLGVPNPFPDSPVARYVPDPPG